MIEFPIKYFEGNLVFSQDDSCWAYYEIPGFNYDYLDENEKVIQFQKAQAFFWQINMDSHCLVVPNFSSIHEKHENFKRKLNGPLKDVATKHTDDTADRLEELLGDEATEYRFFIGVKLAKPDREKTNLFDDIKETIKGFLNNVHEKAGLEAPEILEEELIRFRKNERRTFNKVYSRFNAIRASELDIQWLVRRNFYRGMGKPPILKNWSPAYSVHYTEYERDDVKVRRPLYYDILRLTEGKIDETAKRSLLIQQNIEGEEHTGHCAFLTVANVPYEMDFPGDEWLYAIQSLDFPVEISMRTETMENRKALSAIRNKQKELKDQDRHAQETNNDTGLTVVEGRAEAQQLEALLQKSRMPLIKTSITFCVSANDEEELKRRIDSLHDMYQDMMFQIEQPYGDQFLLFNDFLPGGKRYVKDYIHFMEPATVAGSMYGATKQIGDGEGFFIGSTGILDQPVYISPNRAAQSIKGAKTSALSASFTGSLGGGKSFSANLITYLSVLAGGKALVIDPKGERGNWAEDLQDLGGQVNIITLSTDEEDRGKLDPYSILSNRKDAKTLALDILTFLTGVQMNDSERFPKLSRAVNEVTNSENPCMNRIVENLLSQEDQVARSLGEHIQSFQELSFAQLLFGSGQVENPINLETAMNVLQIQNLQLPSIDKKTSEYNLSEMLSVAMMLPISSFALEFIHMDRGLFKVVLLDEAWAVLNTMQGKHLASKLIREGRSMQSAIYLVTQNADDLLDEKMKNNIGMKYAFRSTDPNEIKNILEFFNLKDTEYNRSTLRELQPGQCLFQDIHGRCGVVSINALFQDLFDAFDTRPPEQQAEENEREKEVSLI